MLRTRFLALSGTILTLSSLMLESQFLGHQRAVLMLQAGIVALGLGLFFRLNSGESGDSGPLANLYDIESESSSARRRSG